MTHGNNRTNPNGKGETGSSRERRFRSLLTAEALYDVIELLLRGSSMKTNSGDALLGPDFSIDYRHTCISCDVGGRELPESALRGRRQEWMKL